MMKAMEKSIQLESREYNNSILIVDDEPGILKSIERLLKPFDYTVFSALSGNEGLEILNENEISLIISDHQMPGMLGVEFLKLSVKVSPKTIRILLTGQADQNSIVEAINKGDIKYFINKPWDDDLLISRIKESVEYYNTILENESLHKLTKWQNKKLQETNDNLENRVEEQTKEIKRKHDELENSFLETIKAFSQLLELRHKEVGSHSSRVVQLTKKVLDYFDLSSDENQEIIVAAHLHDIGKISLPDRILRKAPDDYTSAERESIKTHPIIGQTCLYNISNFEEIGVLIRNHHENFDGSGYPDKLYGSQIPLGSQIIRICDAFDHLTFNNGYPDLKTINKACSQIVYNQNKFFDPKIVKIFIEAEIGKTFYYDDISDIQSVKVIDLIEGMYLAEDIYTRNNMFLLPKGAKLTRNMITRIKKISMADPIDNGIKIYDKTALVSS